MNKIDEVSNVDNFDIFNNSLVLQINNKLINKENNEIVEDDILGFDVINSKLFLAKGDKVIVCSEETKITIKGNFSFHHSMFYDGFCLIIGKVDGEKKIKKINFETGKVCDVSVTPYYPHYAYGNCGLVVSDFIELFNPFNGESFWKRGFTSLLDNKNAEQYGNLQIIDQKLFFFLFDGSRLTDDSKTFCLDANTGNVLFKTEKFGAWLTKFNNKIYAVKEDMVQILDPKSFDIETINLKDCISFLDKEIHYEGDPTPYKKTFYLSHARYQIEGNFLFFTQDKGNILGVIDIKNKMLISHTELEIKDEDLKAIGEIKIDDKKIYVTDSDHKLTIFSRPKQTLANKI